MLPQSDDQWLYQIDTIIDHFKGRQLVIIIQEQLMWKKETLHMKIEHDNKVILLVVLICVNFAPHLYKEHTILTQV